VVTLLPFGFFAVIIPKKKVIKNLCIPFLNCADVFKKTSAFHLPQILLKDQLLALLSLQMLPVKGNGVEKKEQ